VGCADDWGPDASDVFENTVPRGIWRLLARRLWRPGDGKELYYLNPAGDIVRVPITVTGTTLQPGTPKVLFRTRIWGGGVDAQHGRQYDVAPDGRFLINTILDSAPAPITLLQNWNPAAKK
jgi:hypothetical protein